MNGLPNQLLLIQVPGGLSGAMQTTALPPANRAAQHRESEQLTEELTAVLLCLCNSHCRENFSNSESEIKTKPRRKKKRNKKICNWNVLSQASFVSNRPVIHRNSLWTVFWDQPFLKNNLPAVIKIWMCNTYKHFEYFWNSTMSSNNIEQGLSAAY